MKRNDQFQFPMINYQAMIHWTLDLPLIHYSLFIIPYSFLSWGTAPQKNHRIHCPKWGPLKQFLPQSIQPINWGRTRRQRQPCHRRRRDSHDRSQQPARRRRHLHLPVRRRGKSNATHSHRLGRLRHLRLGPSQSAHRGRFLQRRGRTAKAS